MTRLGEFLIAATERSAILETRRIVDNDNNVIAQSADAMDSPTIMRSAAASGFRGVVVGRIRNRSFVAPRVLLRTGGRRILLRFILSWLAYATAQDFPSYAR